MEKRPNSSTEQSGELPELVIARQRLAGHYALAADQATAENDARTYLDTVRARFQPDVVELPSRPE